MRPATIIVKQSYYFACPHCGDEEQHEITHFMEDDHNSHFGPWQCDECGWVVPTGFWDAASKTVYISEPKERPIPPQGYMLMRVSQDEPVWIIVEEKIHTRDQMGTIEEEIARKRYWVDSHTCPTNIVRVTEIIEGVGPTYNQDPHGVLEFVAWAPAGDIEPDDVDWREVFPQLSTATIDATADDETKLITSE